MCFSPWRGCSLPPLLGALAAQALWVLTTWEGPVEWILREEFDDRCCFQLEGLRLRLRGKLTVYFWDFIAIAKITSLLKDSKPPGFGICLLFWFLSPLHFHFTKIPLENPVGASFIW